MQDNVPGCFLLTTAVPSPNQLITVYVKFLFLCSSLPRGKAEDANSWRIVLGKHQLKRAESAERIFLVKRI